MYKYWENICILLFSITYLIISLHICKKKTTLSVIPIWGKRIENSLRISFWKIFTRICTFVSTLRIIRDVPSVWSPKSWNLKCEFIVMPCLTVHLANNNYFLHKIHLQKNGSIFFHRYEKYRQKLILLKFTLGTKQKKTIRLKSFSTSYRKNVQ